MSSNLHRTLVLRAPRSDSPGTRVRFAIVATLTLALMSCDFVSNGNERLKNAVVGKLEYQTVEWTELMPEADLEALLNPPDYLFDVVEGSAEDQQLFEQLASGKVSDQLDPYQQALLSTDVRSEFDGSKIRIAGYLVPLEFDSPEVVTKALLVPYFGACIHVPPPPPNQIILLNADDGVNLNDMYNPYWVEGELKTTLYESELATSAYEMNVTRYELYTEQSSTEYVQPDPLKP